jgi:hypothetical protein
VKEPTWKTQDGRVIPIRVMADRHLDNAIKYFEDRGAIAYCMTPEEREADPLSMAEFNMCDLADFAIEKYKQLVEEKRRRSRAVKNARLAMLEHPKKEENP